MRDTLLGRPLHDLDWLVAEPEPAARSAAAALGGTHFALDEARGHWRVVSQGGEVRTRDYLRLHGDLERDLVGRDFTVNAMALSPAGELIDPLGGARDLRRRRLRLASGSALQDDPLRALRGLRLWTTLEFDFTPDTREALRDCAGQQARGAWPVPAMERVREEFDRLLLSPRAARGLQEARRLGLLELYLPELAAAEGVAQGGFHHLDVLEHSLAALAQLVQGFPEADLALRWATLLHDVGKPATKTFDPEGKFYHFYGHAKLGAGLAAALLGRLRYPERVQRRVAKLVHYHMLPLPRNEREARRFVHRRRALLPDLLKLMIADREAARGPRSSEAGRQAYRLALARVLEIMKTPSPRVPLLDGREVMALLGLAEGPRIGQALRFLREAQAVGDVRNRAEAEAALQHYAERQGWLEPVGE